MALGIKSKEFFVQHLLVEQHRSREALTVLGELQLAFPNSSYVLSQTAVAHYHLRDFDQGHADFKELRRRDPLRVEGLDVFSNILYVKECKAELSYLAHMTVKSSPLRPETNCIIGNYYSLKGQHEKAVMYFLRALKLDRRCLSAWTLMGHEFVELKNAGAAIESYRQAVDINCKDYRPWYGLGQAYEIIQMHLYAIYYYRRATALRPYDARMWVAMGKCLEELGKRSEAISTYERAMANDDREGISLNRLAELYTHEGKRDPAAKCYEMMLQRKDRDNTSAEKGMNFLCRYYRDVRDYDNALRMAHALLDFTASREDALAMLREIRSISEAEKKPAMHSSPLRHREKPNVTPRGFDHRYGASGSGVSPGARGVAIGAVDRGISRPGLGPATRARDRESNYRKAEEAADVAPYNLSLGESPSILSRSSVDMSVAMSIASDSGEEGAEGAGDSGSRRGGRPGRVTPRRPDAELDESGAGIGDVDSSAELLSP